MAACSGRLKSEEDGGGGAADFTPHVATSCYTPLFPPTNRTLVVVAHPRTKEVSRLIVSNVLLDTPWKGLKKEEKLLPDLLMEGLFCAEVPIFCLSDVLMVCFCTHPGEAA